MRKILLTATVLSHIAQFHKPLIRLLKNNGYEVHVAAKNNLAEKNGLSLNEADVIYNIPFSRSPKSFSNVKAYKELKKIIAENQYDVISCNTPMGGVVTRLVARKMRKRGTRVIYMAHGFHFFKGAPLLNWLIYLPVEWICSFFTDTLITINQEDFEFAKKHLHAKKIEYIHGVGLDIDKFKNIEVDRDKKRQELGIPKDSFAVLSVGELNDNKNHETVLRAIAKLEKKDIVYIICGQGDKKEYLESLAKELGMEERLILPGYRTDVSEIYKCCDVFVFPSKREGLPVSVMEALVSGLPCVASKIRGNVDLIKDGENGFLCSAEDSNTFAENIDLILKNRDFAMQADTYNQKIMDLYNGDAVIEELRSIYKI